MNDDPAGSAPAGVGACVYMNLPATKGETMTTATATPTRNRKASAPLQRLPDHALNVRFGIENRADYSLTRIGELLDRIQPKAQADPLTNGVTLSNVRRPLNIPIGTWVASCGDTTACGPLIGVANHHLIVRDAQGIRHLEHQTTPPPAPRLARLESHKQRQNHECKEAQQCE